MAVLEKRGRFLVAEPLFGTGPRTAVERGGAERGRPGAGRRRQARRPRGAQARPAGRGSRRARGPDARPRPASLLRALGHHGEAEAAADDPFAADARVDLTELPTFTIDPDDAKDFDDAISARREDGHVRLWVHIADVTAYVRPGSPLEREASRRATSVYVPGAVEPMLPEVLSNRACSLRPGEDKLAVTVEMEMHGTDVRSVSLSPLADAQRRAPHLRAGRRGASPAASARRGPVGGPLAAAREVAARTRRKRDSLEIGSPEPIFEFDAEGHVTGVRYEEQTESHRLIEQLMILANEQVAGYLADASLPTLYRVHERPEPHRCRVPARAAREPRHPHAAGARAHDAAAGGGRGHGGIALVARERTAGARSACSCCAR